MAFDAFVQGVASYHFDDAFFALAQQDATDELFTEHQQLAAMIDRLTYMGAAELFLEGDTSLLRPLQSRGVHPLVIAAIIDRQKRSLEESKWKPKVRKVVKGLLDDLSSLYDAAEYPIRRARANIWKLEMACSSNEGELYIDALAQEALETLSVEVSLLCVTC
jgi:separase